MSKATETLNTRNQLNTNYDFSKTFIGDNDFRSETINNPEAGEVTLPVGQVMGRISASGIVIPLKSAAVDGSQYPVGILAEELTLAAAGSAQSNICIGGDVNEKKLVFDGTDTLSTVVDGRRLYDRIASDNLGIYFVQGTELTDFDNS